MYVSLCMRKPTIWAPTWSDTNRAIQSQTMVRGWKLWIKKVEELHYPCSENKGADQLRSSAPLFSSMHIVGCPMRQLIHVYSVHVGACMLLLRGLIHEQYG